MPELTISEVARQVGTPSISDPLLRENWTASPGPANERAETIRRCRSLSPGNHSACASTRFYIDGNPTLVLWFSRHHSSLGTLANALPKKACGVRSSDGWNKSSARRAQKVDDEVPMRHPGSMWQGHIPEHKQRCSRQEIPCNSSRSRTHPNEFAALTKRDSSLF